MITDSTTLNELGLDSLEAVPLFAAIEKQFDIELIEIWGVLF